MVFVILFSLITVSCKSSDGTLFDPESDTAANNGLANVALNKAYLSSRESVADYPDTDNKELTDGKYDSSVDYTKSEWSVKDYKYTQTIDLGGFCSIKTMTINFLHNEEQWFQFPGHVRFKYSRNNKDFYDLGDAVGKINKNNPNLMRYFLDLKEPVIGRYVLVKVTPNWWAFSDELEIWGTPYAGTPAAIAPPVISPSAPKGGPYFELTEGKTVLTGTPGTWDGNGVHILSIVEANKDGYKYWGYYCGGAYYYSYGVGLARSNDLIKWDKYETSEKINIPIVGTDKFGYGGRWPTVAYDNETFYMFVTKDFDSDSHICLYTSTDGIAFDYKQNIMKPAPMWRNQNPFLFKNTNDGKWYLYYYSGNDADKFFIKVRCADKIDDIAKAKDVVVMSDVDDEIVAAPSMFTWNKKYYLLTETTIKNGNDWRTVAWVSDRPDGGFLECSNSPLPADVHACAFQFYLNNNLYITYSHQISADPNWVWDLRIRKATNLQTK